MAFLVLFLGCYGLTMILVQSVIMAPLRSFLGRVRFFKGLLACMMCTGFWVSLLCTIITKYSLAAVYLSLTGPVGYVFSACALTTLITFTYLIQLAVENYFKIDW